MRKDDITERAKEMTGHDWGVYCSSQKIEANCRSNDMN